MSASELFRRPRRPPTPTELAEILQVWRGIWLIVSARGVDALTAEVERLGTALKAAADAGDRAAIMRAVDAAHAWLETLAGVVTNMMTAPLRRLL